MAGLSTILIVGASVAIGAYGARTDKRRRTAVLRTIAERRRGTLDTGGWFGNPLVDIDLSDGVEIRISMWSTKHGKFTEYSVTLPSPGLPAFDLEPPGVLDRITQALGTQDITTGDHDFDQAFVLEGRDAGAIRRVWRSARTRRLAVAYRSSRLKCEGSRMRLLQPVIESVEQVETGIDLLLELARCDPYAFAVLDELPEGDVHSTAGGFHEAELPGPSRIRIGPLQRDGIVRSCARTAALGALPPDAETQVTALGATLEQTDAEVRIWWPSVEDDVRRLTAAADLLRRLASGPALGVFR